VADALAKPKSWFDFQLESGGGLVFFY